MQKINVTKHGKKRAKERSGIGKSDKKIKKAAQKAYEQGTRFEELKGTFKRYFERQYENYKGGDIRLYGGQIWVFDNNKLVTVKPIPSRYQLKYNIYKKGHYDEEEI